jgi:hypothetical protein
MEKENTDNKFEKFPTRDDIKTALENLNQSLDRRFGSIHELLTLEVSHRDKQLQTLEDSIRDKIASRDKELTTLDNALRDKIASVQREMTITNEASEGSIAKADAANEKRFESVSEKIGLLNDRMNRDEGRGAGVAQLAGWIFGGVGLLVGLIAIFAWLSNMQPKVERNSEFREQVAPALKARP